MDTNDFSFWAEMIAIVIGLATLLAGVVNSIRTNKQTVTSQHLQIILSLSESFMTRWESGWGDTLGRLDASHLTPRTEQIPEKYIDDVQYMLNWVDWLGAIKTSGVLNELNLLTPTLAIPIKKILNCGYTLLKKDTVDFGPTYWQNLFVVGEALDVSWIAELQKTEQ